jgi:uncharacterized protein YndB with AHSA1/START domain
VPDILQRLAIEAPPAAVFSAITTSRGLDAWWTLRCAGSPTRGETYELFFGEPHDWRAVVTRCVSDAVFELTLTRSDADWDGTVLSFTIDSDNGSSIVEFAHTGWRTDNTHFRTTAHCWALYLRLLRRFVEHGEVVPYDARLSA